MFYGHILLKIVDFCPGLQNDYIKQKMLSIYNEVPQILGLIYRTQSSMNGHLKI